MDVVGKWLDRDWVSKTAFVDHLRCPYAAWLLYTGQVERRDSVDVLTVRIIEEGKVFHEGVVATAKPLPRDVDVRRLIAADHCVFEFPGSMKNLTYGILGRPDGVRTAHGALLPIEIKCHREVTRLDELELAFYWLLLEAIRTREDVTPLGYVVARVDNRAETIEVPLKPKRFDEVLTTLDAIREARRNGVVPRFCRCPVCKTDAVQDEIERTALKGKDLSLVYGVGRYFAKHLEALGIRSYLNLKKMVMGRRPTLAP
jgi:CRISPR/Cas system-associated exonuclease Cas4 (RecB family)